MIKSVRVKHFKAIEDSGLLKLGPLTVFVGHNGSGKSSIIEALEFFASYAQHGMERAIEPWFDYSHIWWQGAKREKSPSGNYQTRPLILRVNGKSPDLGEWKCHVQFSELTETTGQYSAGSFAPVIEEYSAGRKYKRSRNCGEKTAVEDSEDVPPFFREPAPIEPLFRIGPHPRWNDWQFLNPDPLSIAAPVPARQSVKEIMQRSGANLAGRLRSFLDKDPDGFEAMIDSLSYILPYASGLQPVTTKDLINKQTFFQLTENFEKNGHVNLPSWVLSGGTLRLLSILTALRHPQPPPVLFIEELENGLDPRALGFLVEEIKYAIEEGQTQVIATTHSPYLLDKLSLDHIITVDREPGGPPVFTKASDNPELEAWSERFAPGSLYTMGMFRKKGGKQ